MKSSGENDYLKEIRIRKLNTHSWICCSFICDLGQITSRFFSGHLIFIPLAIKHT